MGYVPQHPPPPMTAFLTHLAAWELPAPRWPTSRALLFFQYLVKEQLMSHCSPWMGRITRKSTETKMIVSSEQQKRLWESQPVWNFVTPNLTSDFPDGLSGISPHYGKCDYSIVFTTLQKGWGEEASCAHMSWMNIPLDNMFTQILLWTNERSSFSSSAFRICTC